VTRGPGRTGHQSWHIDHSRCGYTLELYFWLSQQGWEVILIDISEARAEQAREFQLNRVLIHFVVDDLTRFNTSQTQFKTDLDPVMAGRHSEVFKTLLDARLEPVANSPQRFQIAGMPRVLLDFLPQAPYENVDGARRYERAFFPNSIEQLVASKNAPSVPH
jgi:hypothetical protein